MVYVAPTLLQTPALVKVTCNPELAVAATVNWLPPAALAGALILNVIVCATCEPA
jgi:hypothetical protein